MLRWIAVMSACALLVSPVSSVAQTATGGSAVATATTSATTATTPAATATTPAATATTPTATATTPTATATAPPTTAPPAATTTPPATTAPAPASTAPKSSDGGSRAPVGLIVLGALALALLVLWGIARWWAWEPRWLVRWRHATGEAGWRVSNAWAEFTDWLRLGR